MEKMFSQAQLQAIADALGDTNEGLTGSEIAHFLRSSKIDDPDAANTKRHRLYNAFALSQNTKQHRRNILEFIRVAMRPEQYARDADRYEPMRANVNRALAFSGLAVQQSGKLVSAEAVETLGQAQRREAQLRADLELRRVHADVLQFCKEELLHENYFHAVLEATKSVADKLRTKSGLTDDGGILVDRVLGGETPMLAINPMQTESERSEQKGFVNLVKGLFGMFRNPGAHAPKITWAVNKDDAEEVFTLLSLVHRRIDAAHMPPRA